MSVMNEEKVVIYVERFQTIVAAGGIEGFLRSPAGDHVQETLNALLVIREFKGAALLRRAMLMFENKVPPREQAARCATLDTLGAIERDLLHQLDEICRRREEELKQLLAQYKKTLEERYCLA